MKMFLLGFFFVVAIGGIAISGFRSPERVVSSTPVEFTYTIRVTGAPGGLRYSGAILRSTSSGTVSQSVTGQVDNDYVLRGSSVSVTFQKESDWGKLRLQVFRDLQLIAERETTAPYGIVSIATR